MGLEPAYWVSPIASLYLGDAASVLRELSAESVDMAAHRERREDVTMRFLAIFLSNAFADKNIYVAGQEASKRELL